MPAGSIVKQRAARLLAVAACTVLAARAQQSGVPLRFEVASVRQAAPDPRVQACLCEPPGRVAYRTAPLKWIVMRAFALQDPQIQGPAWLDSATFDIEATFPPGASPENLPEMLRALLRERFHLEAHTENRVMPSFVLKVAPKGTKLQAPKEGFEFSFQRNKTGIHLRQLTNMKDFAAYLSTQLDRPVADGTGLDGVYAVELDFAPDSLARPNKKVDSAPALPDALLQQLGLRLETGKAPAAVLVIDRVDKAPTEN
jgi:uncharacterized protein (TIGR03435 family)